LLSSSSISQILPPPFFFFFPCICKFFGERSRVQNFMSPRATSCPVIAIRLPQSRFSAREVRASFLMRCLLIHICCDLCLSPFSPPFFAIRTGPNFRSSPSLFSGHISLPQPPKSKRYQHVALPVFRGESEAISSCACGARDLPRNVSDPLDTPVSRAQVNRQVRLSIPS